MKLNQLNRDIIGNVLTFVSTNDLLQYYFSNSNHEEQQNAALTELFSHNRTSKQDIRYQQKFLLNYNKNPLN